MAAKPKSEKGGTKTGKPKGKGTKWARESEEEGSEGDKGGKKCDDETDWVAQIQARTECGEHMGKHCFVDEAGVHQRLSKQDLSLWGLMVVSFGLFILSLLAKHSSDYSHGVTLAQTLSSHRMPSSSRCATHPLRNMIVHPSLVGCKVPYHFPIHTLCSIPILCSTSASTATSLWILWPSSHTCKTPAWQCRLWQFLWPADQLGSQRC